MTDIIKLARERSYRDYDSDKYLVFLPEEIEAFAAAIRKEERERCAVVCEELSGMFHAHGHDCAAAIRAMKE